MTEANDTTPIRALSAITLAVTDMARSVRFYRDLGFALKFGGEDARFTSFYAGSGFLNLLPDADAEVRFWGRVIFYVDDVDAMHRRALQAGLAPHFEPEDAPWGERYFHLSDPDGHELSFARPLE